MRYSRLNPISKIGGIIILASIFFPWISIKTTFFGTTVTNMSFLSLLQFSNMRIGSLLLNSELQSIIIFTFIALILSCVLVFFYNIEYGVIAGFIGILYFTVTSGINFQGLFLILNLNGILSGLNLEGPLTGSNTEIGFYAAWIGVILMGIGIIPWRPNYRKKYYR